MTGNVRQTPPEPTCGTLLVTSDNSPTFDGTGPQNAPEGTEDMKSIDKLREYVCSAPMSSMTNVARAIVVDMTDEIEREVKELTDERDLLKTQWEAGVDFDQRLEACADKREDVTLFGVDYTALPVDADGVPIHVGDVMDEQLPFGGYAAPAPVDTMELSRGAGGYGWMVRLDSESGVFINPKLLRHHHAPTVEDVLREFFSRYVTTKPKEEDDAIIAEYAARLRLAESE